MSRWFLIGLLLTTASITSACAEDTGACASSAPLADGATTTVEVVVVTKDGLDANVIGSIDVNGGLYGTPQKPIKGDQTTTASIADLPLGEYDGTVSRVGDQLTLAVEDQEFPLEGPESCP